MRTLVFLGRLVFGAVRAIFISGGVSWRIVLVPAVIPQVRAQPWGPKVLDFFPISEWPDSYFYFAALLASVLILAFRVAWLEVHRIRIEDREIDKVGDAEYLKIRISNRSFKGVENLKMSIVSCDPPMSFINNPTALPIILTTQQRLQRQRANIEAVPRRRFSMPAWDRKWIEVFWTNNGVEARIDHENGSCEIRVFMEYLINLELNGAGGNIQFGLQIVSNDNGRWNAFIIRDIADLCALEQLGLRGWW